MLIPLLAYGAALNETGQSRSAWKYWRIALTLLKRLGLTGASYSDFYNDAIANRLQLGMSVLDKQLSSAEGYGQGLIPDNNIRNSTAFSLFVNAIGFGTRGHFEVAKSYLSQSISKGASFPDPLFVLGTVYYNEGRVTDAVERWTKSLSIINPQPGGTPSRPSYAQTEALIALCALHTASTSKAHQALETHR